MSKVKKIFSTKFTYVGLFVGVVMALLSMTPSLLPRVWLFQGVLTGLVLATGYGVGNAISATYRFFELPEPSKKNKKVFKQTSVVLGVLALVWFMVQSADWNNRVLELVGEEASNVSYPIRVIITAALIAYLVVAISRLFRGFVRVVMRWVYKYIPKKLAKPVGATLGIVLLIFILNGVVLRGVMAGVNYGFSLRDGATNEGIVQPESELRSGSEDSLVSWDSLGRQGRNFTGGGPTVEELNDFSGGDAQQPIRVYVGMKSADTLEERAELALEELIRTKAFDREVLIVTTTTGTGWLDPGAVDTVEYVHNGDTAIVGMQYSFLPSWISLFVDQQITKDTARATLQAVHGYWSQLDEAERPELYLFGLSLGSFGSQDSARDLRLINDPVDGALWAGPPFVSDAWLALTEGRDEDSPAWKPVVDEGRVVRFTGEENTLGELTAEWGDTKYAFLQHPSDPITFFSPDLLLSSPEWLEGERGPDVTTDMDWYPFVTFWQVAADLPMAGAVPAGHGHAYNPSSYIDVWAEITEPDDWNEDKAEQLKAVFETE